MRHTREEVIQRAIQEFNLLDQLIATGAAPADLQSGVAAIGDDLSAVIASGKMASDATSGLAYLWEAAGKIDQGRPYTPLSQLDSTMGANLTAWNQFEQHLDLHVGVLIQYFVYAAGDPQGVVGALDLLADLLDARLAAAEDQVLDAVARRAGILEQMAALRDAEAAADVETGPQRPGWLQ